jgi:hypothetical protein
MNFTTQSSKWAQELHNTEHQMSARTSQHRAPNERKNFKTQSTKWAQELHNTEHQMSARTSKHRAANETTFVQSLGSLVLVLLVFRLIETASVLFQINDVLRLRSINFQENKKKSRSHLKIPEARRVTWSKFHTEEPQILHFPSPPATWICSTVLYHGPTYYIIG